MEKEQEEERMIRMEISRRRKEKCKERNKERGREDLFRKDKKRYH